MKSIGQQFADKMLPRITDEKFSQAAVKFAEDFVADAKERTLSGNPLPFGKWKNFYEDTQARKHGRRTPVTLRDTGNSMNSLRATRAGRGAVVEGNELLRRHDEGDVNGGPRHTRQLIPKEERQIPLEVMAQLRIRIKEILDGHKDG